jgi:hypothetical protein
VRLFSRTVSDGHCVWLLEPGYWRASLGERFQDETMQRNARIREWLFWCGKSLYRYRRCGRNRAGDKNWLKNFSSLYRNVTLPSLVMRSFVPVVY